MTPDELWMPALAPRTSGWLPDVGGRRPTCLPVRGEPTEKDLSLLATVSGPRLRTTNLCPLASYQHIRRAVRLTLNLGALREPVRSFRKPRTIPHPEPDQGPPQGTRADEDPQRRRTLRRQPWVKPQFGTPGAQAMWDAWTKTAEDWLLDRAGIGRDEEGPYRGRGTAPIVRKRMPSPFPPTSDTGRYTAGPRFGRPRQTVTESWPELGWSTGSTTATSWSRP